MSFLMLETGVSRGRKETSHVYTCSNAFDLFAFMYDLHLWRFELKLSLPHRRCSLVRFVQSSNELENFYVFSSGWEN